MKGEAIIRWSWRGTAALVATAVAADAARGLRPLAATVALGLFAAGLVVFIVALARAAGRSRADEIGMGGLFFLQGSAPRRVQLHLLGSLTVQVVAALATAAVRPYTSLAFGVLAPVYGLALAGLWAARYGSFGPRQVPVPRPRR